VLYSVRHYLDGTDGRVEGGALLQPPRRLPGRRVQRQLDGGLRRRKFSNIHGPGHTNLYLYLSRTRVW